MTVVPVLMFACTNESAPAAVSGQDPAELIGTLWQTQEIDMGGVIDPSSITLQFEMDGRIVGSTGCNLYSGDVKMGSGSIVVTGTATTRKACGPALMQQEQKFLSSLQAVSHYELDGDFLMLFDPPGEQRMKLIRTPATHPADNRPVPQDRIDPNAASDLRFTCEDGVALDVRFIGPETLLLSLADHEHILTRERTASGAAYSDEGITFWNKGSEAILLVDDVKVACQKSD